MRSFVTWSVPAPVFTMVPEAPIVTSGFAASQSSSTVVPESTLIVTTGSAIDGSGMAVNTGVRLTATMLETVMVRVAIVPDVIAPVVPSHRWKR